MAKKIVFLLVAVFVLLIASVTAFAVETEAPSPEVGFTNDKADIIGETTDASLNVDYLESKYEDVFFGDDSSTEDRYVVVKYNRENTLSGLRYNFTGSLIDSSEGPVVLLMYIKVDGEYVPLNDIHTKTNMSEEIFTCANVDLKYLGSDKVNEVRIIAFKAENADKLVVDENLQISNLNITADPWTLGEKVKITIDSIKNALNTP